MKNRDVGVLVISIALLIAFITYSFNQVLTSIVNESCSHGTSCPMFGTINFQTNVSLGIIIIIMLFGIYLIFFTKEQNNHAEIRKSDYSDTIKTLTSDEKKIFEKIIEEEGTIFQSDLVEKTKLSKVKVTRMLDRLEGKNLVERKRRGMSNIVILKRM